MFLSILVPVDGSVFGEHALPLAVSIARRSGATLRLLHVVPDLADSLFWVPMPGDPIDVDLHQAHQADAQNYLDGLVARLQDAGVGPVICDIVEEYVGITDTIRAHVAKTQADLVVLSSHGRGALARFWLGSNADELVRSLAVPVLLARPGPAAPDLSHEVVFKHLLLALDGTTLAEQIMPAALAIGSAMGADYTLVRAIHHPLAHLPHLMPPAAAPREALAQRIAHISERVRQDAEDYLETVADILRAEGAHVQIRTPVGRHAADAILHEAAATAADLIALETHGRRGLSRLLMGGTADKVIRGSSLPVLVCRFSSAAVSQQSV
jgi:nucleotide-binding universal stress UspA family protein